MLKELKEIADNQKTIRTSKLQPYIKYMFETFQKINQELYDFQKRIHHLNSLLQSEKSKNERLKKQFTILNEKYKVLKRMKGDK